MLWVVGVSLHIHVRVSVHGMYSTDNRTGSGVCGICRALHGILMVFPSTMV